MPRRAKEDAVKTRERILASALSLFARKGYDHTTFNDIAARLKMTKGAVYWHFESKEKLLNAIVDEMFERFLNQIETLLPEGEKSFDRLSFPDVSDMMVRHAMMTVSNPQKTSFFMLMHEQIRWSSASMSIVRENILKSKRCGPWEAFHVAVENDIHNGLVRAEVDSKQVASCCMALWNGLVRAHIDNFLQCDLEETLKNAFAAIWRDISRTAKRFTTKKDEVSQ